MAKLRQNKRWKMDLFTDDSGAVWRVHKAATCEGSYCAIHNPSDHPLKYARRVLRWPDPFSLKPTGFVERICAHGHAHSDPDSVAFHTDKGLRGLYSHACCESRCCRGEMETAIDDEDWQPEDGVATDPLDMSKLSEYEIDVEVARFALRLAAMPDAEG